MTCEFLAQTGNLRRGDRAAFVPPLLANVSENVGDLRVGQRFVPRLHHGGAELLALHCHGPLQSFQYNHSKTTRPAVYKFRSGQRRITLTRGAKSIRLMTDGAIGRENLFAAIGLRKFRRLFPSGTAGPLFLGRHESGIKTVAAEISREPAEISAAKKDREPVNRNEPDGERLEAGARFALFALDRGVDLMDVRRFAVVHPLAHVASSGRLVHFFSSLAGAGEGAGDAAAAGDVAGAGEEAGAGTDVSFASLSSCDWSSDIK